MKLTNHQQASNLVANNDIELINAIRSKRGVLIQLAIGHSFVLDEFSRLIEAPGSERLSFFDNSLVCILATSYK